MTINHRYIKSRKSQNRKILLIVGFILLFLFLAYYQWTKALYINKSMYFTKGDSIQKIVPELSFFDKFRFKFYLKYHKSELASLVIKPGVYSFSGYYSKAQVIEQFKAGPTQKYLKFVILEGRSKYDIDKYLTTKGAIQKGAYISFVEDKNIIKTYLGRYDFLSDANKSLKGNLESLEGFLYPDTYMVDPANNIIDQLVYLQLDAFRKKVWEAIKDKEYKTYLSKLGQNYKFKLSFYDTITLSSIIEKEEKNDGNKPVISSIFLNRISKDMRLDADISLCYGLKISYDECGVDKISTNIKDNTNLYNTRANKGLTPTPIGNPSVSTILSILNFQKTDYLFYLHDLKGNFHPSKDIQDHNIKKSKYLNN